LEEPLTRLAVLRQLGSSQKNGFDLPICMEASPLEQCILSAKFRQLDEYHGILKRLAAQ
jgi:hypothetical protein